MAKRKPKPADLAPPPDTATVDRVVTTSTTNTTPPPHTFAELAPVTCGEREVAANVLRKHLAFDRPTAEATVAELNDDQVRAVLSVQLETDAAQSLAFILSPN